MYGIDNGVTVFRTNGTKLRVGHDTWHDITIHHWTWKPRMLMPAGLVKQNQLLMHLSCLLQRTA